MQQTKTAPQTNATQQTNAAPQTNVVQQTNAVQPTTMVRPRGAERQLDDAIERGRAVLLAAQQADGGWDAETIMGPGLVAALVVTEHYLGTLEPADGRGCLLSLLDAQEEDGGFLGHPHALASDPTTTRLCVAALRLLGADGVSALRRAERYLASVPSELQISRGDEVQFSFLSLFLIIAGAIPDRALPRIPIETALLPGLDRLVDRRIHAGNIVAMFTLAAAVDRRRSSERRGLFAAGTRAMARARIVDYLETQQNPNGSWNSASIQTLTMLVGYAAAGLGRDDPRVVRALGFIERHKRREDGRLWLHPFTAEVWCTAYSVMALDACGEADDEAMLGGAEYLLSVQSRTPQPRYTQPKRGVPRTGGWPFETGNALLPDCDDTGVALEALGMVQRRQPSRLIDSAIREGIAWLEAMQNPSGGWAAYVWGLGDKPPGPAFVEPPAFRFDDPRMWLSVLRDPPAELSDPAWEDITARVLSGLGACGLTADHPMVRRAVAFLGEQQCDNGAWWGRWIGCYLPGTAHTLMGLAAVGSQAPMASRAIAWLAACQNDDGGWGEPIDVYRHPSRAGRGASNACATALVVQALVDFGLASDEMTKRGVAYLVRAQRDDGTWPSGAFVHVLVPPDAFYQLGISPKVYPLRALGAYRRAVSS